MISPRIHCSKPKKTHLYGLNIILQTPTFISDGNASLEKRQQRECKQRCACFVWRFCVCETIFFSRPLHSGRQARQKKYNCEAMVSINAGSGVLTSETSNSPSMNSLKSPVVFLVTVRKYRSPVETGLTGDNRKASSVLSSSNHVMLSLENRLYCRLSPGSGDSP